MEKLAALDGPDWFRLGDLDLATHLYRTQRLREGASLTTVTTALCTGLGIHARVLPASDDVVRTMVATDAGELPFQHYFVREQCRPAVRGLRFAGAENARPQAAIADLLQSGRLTCVVICPSNPFLSIDPILNIAGMRQLLADSGVPVVAVSPIVAGKALKGPTAKMMTELGLPITAATIAAHYRDILDGLVIDAADAEQRESVEALGVKVGVCSTVMKTMEDRSRLAGEVLQFAASLVH
jgi:LPPG:FO 2-phospho-L-lactate transferase